MGVVVITDEGGTPATPADGAALFSVTGTLKYRDDGGTVHEIVTDNNAALGSGVITNTMLATDIKIGSLGDLDTTEQASVVVAINEINTNADTALAATVALAGGATVTDARLKEWVSGEDYEITAVTYDSDGVVTTATVKWPDGSAGTFTTTTKNSTWLAVDAYTISHTDSSNTVTQTAVTRDVNGQVTVKPALTVA